MNRASLVAIASVLVLAACSKPAAPASNEPDTVPLPVPTEAPAQTAPAEAVTPAKPSGPAEPAQARTDDYAVNGASVTRVEWLTDIDAKLYSNAGGDPAINGLVTYIAFPPESPDESWAVYQVGDFEDWKVVEHGPGRVVLQVRVSRIEPSTGNPVTEGKKLIVGFNTDGARSVTVTPAS